MIDWKKYPDNTPQLNKNYLVTEGSFITTAYLAYSKNYNQNTWYEDPDNCLYGCGITHFAEINFPQ